MTHKKTDSLKGKLIFYRLVVLCTIAFLLIYFEIVNDSDGSKHLSLYIFALIVALPLTMLIDKYIVKFAKKY